MPFLLPLLLLAPQAYDPEIEAVMNRKRKEKAEAAASVPAAPARAATTASDGRIPVPDKYAAKFQACLDQAVEAPDKGIDFAQQWRIEGGSFYARNCMGFAYARAERWAPAIVAFEQGADEAERNGEMVQSGRLWAQAGNAALAAGDAAKARDDFDAASALIRKWSSLGESDQARMRTACREHVRKHFSEDEQISKLLEVYRRAGYPTSTQPGLAFSVG